MSRLLTWIAARLGVGWVFFSVLVLVRKLEVAALRHGNLRKLNSLVGDFYDLGQGSQHLLGRPFVKDMHPVRTGWNANHLQVAILVGDAEIRRLQHHDHGGHGRVNVTEDPDYTLAPEDDGFRCPWRGTPNVKDLAIVVRKSIMENRVVVRKIYSSADHNRKHVGRKRLVFLNHFHVGRLGP